MRAKALRAIFSDVSERAARVVEQALQLSVDERAEVAAEIIASVDGEPDADAEQA